MTGDARHAKDEELQQLRYELIAVNQLFDTYEHTALEQAAKLQFLLEQLGESEAKLQSIIAAALDAVLLVDEKGKLVQWNGAAERMFGYTADALGGRDFHELLALRYHDPFRAAYTRFSETGKGAAIGKLLELTALRRDGSEFPIELSVAAVKLSGRWHAVGILRDVTKRKRAEEKILQLNEELEKKVKERERAAMALQNAKEAAEAANRAKSAFLARMSHEIRTPMNGILGMTELILDTELTAEQREYLGLARLSAESLLSILNDILDLSKIEADQLHLESAPFGLRQSLAETIATLGVRAHQKGLELIYRISPGVPEALLGDSGRLRQILVNLIGNSIKFTEQGEIFVNIEEELQTSAATVLHFSVKDTGIGIPEEKHSRIFEAFSQADDSIARKYGGTGLGLSICLALVKMMGGKLWVESRLGHGSTFHFTARVGVRDALPVILPQPQLDRLRGVDVLVVDDNLTNRCVLHELLTRWGMIPILADGARSALRALETARSAGRGFPLILLDAEVPEMDGFALSDRIRGDPELAGATIMMLRTPIGLTRSGECSYEYGISAYLFKPIREGELLDKIRSVLDKQVGKSRRLAVERASAAGISGARVLLAEDNVVNQLVARRILEKYGCVVTVADDGKAAMHALENDNFDIVLMDVHMPNMTGIEATMAIREKEQASGKHIPILAVTADAFTRTRDECLAAGMSDYISKPIIGTALVSLLEKWLRHQVHSCSR